jgi:hypothetical protein
VNRRRWLFALSIVFASIIIIATALGIAGVQPARLWRRLKVLRVVSWSELAECEEVRRRAVGTLDGRPLGDVLRDVFEVVPAERVLYLHVERPQDRGGAYEAGGFTIRRYDLRDALKRYTDIDEQSHIEVLAVAAPSEDHPELQANGATPEELRRIAAGPLAPIAIPGASIERSVPLAPARPGTTAVVYWWVQTTPDWRLVKVAIARP